jgi:NTP pyrophosphatase (non-canonical NTP hydrolase)
MQANTYQVLAARTVNWLLDNKEIEFHALHGMAGEVGEIHSIYQKVYQGHEFDEEEMKKELGDLLWFIAEYCTIKKWPLEEIMHMNIDKLKRRYPDGFSEELSINRKE